MDQYWISSLRLPIGSLTFGGGYAVLPILQREVVEKRHWATERGTYGLVGQCTPGIIAVTAQRPLSDRDFLSSIGGIVRLWALYSRP